MSSLRTRVAATAIAAVAALTLAGCTSASTGTGSSAAPGSGDTSAGTLITYNSPSSFANFGALLQQFGSEESVAAPSDTKNSGQALAALVDAARAAREVALLPAYEGLPYSARMVGLALAVAERAPAYVPLRHGTLGAEHVPGRLFEDGPAVPGAQHPSPRGPEGGRALGVQPVADRHGEHGGAAARQLRPRPQPVPAVVAGAGEHDHARSGDPSPAPAQALRADEGQAVGGAPHQRGALPALEEGRLGRAHLRPGPGGDHAGPPSPVRSAMTMAMAIPPSCVMVRCHRSMPCRRASSATVPSVHSSGAPEGSFSIQQCCQIIPGGALSAFAAASLAAKRAASERTCRSR